MPHFRSAGVGALCDERNPQDLVAVIADDFQGILIGIFDFFFFFPKQLTTFRTFANEHRHKYSSNSIMRDLDNSGLSVIYLATICQRNDHVFRL